jgi:hypothetical protein
MVDSVQALNQRGMLSVKVQQLLTVRENARLLMPTEWNMKMLQQLRLVIGYAEPSALALRMHLNLDEQPLHPTLSANL